MSDDLFECFDSLLKRWVCGLPRIPRDAEEQEKKEIKRQYLERIQREVSGHFRTREDAFPNFYEQVFHILGVIDQKASAMLTHVSVMIAANALLLQFKTHPALDAASIALMISFIAVALLALRLLRFWTRRFQDPMGGSLPRDALLLDDQEQFREEVFYRGKLYRYCLNGSTALTLLSAVLMFFSIFFV